MVLNDNPNKGNAMRNLNNEPVVAEKRTGLSGNEYEIIKDRFVTSRPWYSTVTAEDGFYIKAGPYRTKKKAVQQIHTWEELCLPQTPATFPS